MAGATRGTKEKLRVSVRACVGASERKRGARVSCWLSEPRKFVAGCFGGKDEAA